MRPPLKRRIRPEDEQGATLAIVAISLIALLGMVVLVVDVGGLLWKRRELVNGSDAAALAAAQTCAVPVSQDPRDARDVADTLAVTNVGGLIADEGDIIAGLDTCRQRSGYVSVRYTDQQQLFFAPVLGAGNSGNVTTEATAIWGTPRSIAPLPIVLYTSTFQGDCDIPSDPETEIPINETCYFWFDNDLFSNSAFGFLNLRDEPPQQGWDVDSAASCPNVGASDRDDWIEGNAPSGDVSLNFPDATYVCRVSGLADSNWATLEDRIGDELVFPVNRCDDIAPFDFGQVDSDGNAVACNVAPDKYDIIGFLVLRLDDVLTPAEADPDGGNCTFGPTNVTGGQTWDLDLLGCPATTPDTFGTPIFDPVRNQDPDPILNQDYTYDPDEHLITWLGAGPALETAQYDIEYTWATDGPCGPEVPSNQSGRCIIATTVEVHIGGEGVCDDCLGNLRTVVLCDPAISGSCDPVSIP